MALPPLYKYLDWRGAVLTLATRTFKHAKPSDFNDTEDLTIQSIFPDDIEVALTKFANGLNDVIVEHINDPPTCRDPDLREKLARLQHVFRENPKAIDMINEEIRNDPSQVYDVKHMREMSNQHIRDINDFMQGYRVLCVSTLKDSERMWSEYAQNHDGIVLRIEPSVERDSKFQLFRPVQYRVSRPSLYDDTRDFMVTSLFGDQHATLLTMVEKISYAKTLKWQHESEYRLLIPIVGGQDWNTQPYHPEEITELYLGLAMAKEKRELIVRMAKAVNPNIVIFQTSQIKR